MRDSQPVRLFAEFRHAPLQLVTDETPRLLPPNPTIPDGIPVRYLGTAPKRLEGEATGYVYHADPMRRDFEVHRDDLRSVLCNRAFVIRD